MGQRLVVTVCKDEKEICKLYYHWSAYTSSALEELSKIIEALEDLNDPSEYDTRLKLIRLCENNGGGIDGGLNSEEWRYIQDHYLNERFKSEDISRNCGLFVMSEAFMSRVQGISEGDIYIDIDNRKIDFQVMYIYNSINALNEYQRDSYNDWQDISLEDIPEIDCFLEEFTFEDVGCLLDVIGNASDYVRYGGIVYEMIR